VTDNQKKNDDQQRPTIPEVKRNTKETI